MMVNLSAALAAGTLFHIEAEEGRGILTFLPTKAYQSVVLCSPELKNGAMYIVYSGGSSTGGAVDGLYSSGTYTAGTRVTSLTTSNMVTTYGSGSMAPAGGISGGGRPGGKPVRRLSVLTCIVTMDYS